MSGCVGVNVLGQDWQQREMAEMKGGVEASPAGLSRMRR